MADSLRARAALDTNGDAAWHAAILRLRSPAARCELRAVFAAAHSDDAAFLRDRLAIASSEDIESDNPPAVRCARLTVRQVAESVHDNDLLPEWATAQLDEEHLAACSVWVQAPVGDPEEAVVRANLDLFQSDDFRDTLSIAFEVFYRDGGIEQ